MDNPVAPVVNNASALGKITIAPGASVTILHGIQPGIVLSTVTGPEHIVSAGSVSAGPSQITADEYNLQIVALGDAPIDN